MEDKVSFITFRFFTLEFAIQDCHPSLYSTKMLYHLYNSDLYNFDSVQKILTALFMWLQLDSNPQPISS